jgi:hypothetical protein
VRTDIRKESYPLSIYVFYFLALVANTVIETGHTSQKFIAMCWEALYRALLYTSWGLSKSMLRPEVALDPCGVYLTASNAGDETLRCYLIVEAIRYNILHPP